MPHKHHTVVASIRNAFSGFRYGLNERNFCIQATVAGSVLILMFIVPLNTLERVILLLCIGMVLGAELFNTALEHLSDFVTEEHHHAIAKVKELSAAGVLLLSIIATITGLWILLPPLMQIIGM